MAAGMKSRALSLWDVPTAAVNASRCLEEEPTLLPSLWKGQGHRDAACARRLLLELSHLCKRRTATGMHAG